VKHNRLLTFLFGGTLILTLILPSYSLDRGELNFSLWNRSFLYSPQSGQENNYETIFHFDLTQSITNYGNLTLWVDELTSPQGNQLAHWQVNWSDLKWGKFDLNISAGDGTIRFTNLESRFINMYHPYLYYRGGQLRISSGSIETTLWGGKLAHLSGLLGTTYEIKDQSLWGFKTKYQKNQNFLLGAGLIHTESPEEDKEDEELFPKKNNIFLLDSEWNIINGLKLLGEYKRSLYIEKDSPQEKGGSFYRLGPLIRTKKLELEANYRYVGTHYRFVSSATQIEEDEKGLFSSLRYKLGSSLTLFGSVDQFRNNLEEDPNKNTLQTFRVFSGFSFFSESFPSITAHFFTTERKSIHDSPDPLHAHDLGVYTQVSENIGRFSPYLRFQWKKSQDKLLEEKNSFLTTSYAGCRYSLRNGSTLWMEGKWENQFLSFQEERNQRLIIRTGMRYNFSPQLNLYSEAYYERSRFRTLRENIELYLGVNYDLPWGLGLRVDFRTRNPLNQDHAGSSHWFTVKLNKRFQWGAPSKILGKIPGQEVTGVGAIQGFVFEDKNQNNLLDPEDERIQGITLSLEEGTTTETDDQGKYKFSKVAEGHHRVKLGIKKIPAYYYILTPSEHEVQVKARKTHQTDFILVSGATLEGKVFSDENRNKKIDPEEKGIPDLLILLKPVDKKGSQKREEYLDQLILNTYTDSEGKYIFDNILPGKYELSIHKESIPKGAAVVEPHPVEINLKSGQKLSDQNILIKPREIIIKNHPPFHLKGLLTMMSKNIKFLSKNV